LPMMLQKVPQKKNWFKFLPLDGESKQFLYFAISSWGELD
jgi:hypothetical protein